MQSPVLCCLGTLFSMLASYLSEAPSESAKVLLIPAMNVPSTSIIYERTYMCQLLHGLGTVHAR